MANTTATLEAIGMRDPWSALNSVPADRLSIAALVLSTSFALWFVSKLYTARSHFAKLRKDGLPVAKSWSWAFGNFLTTMQFGHVLPANASKIATFGEILRENGNAGACYLDLWPLIRPILLVMDPVLAAQACQTMPDVATERPVELQDWFRPLAGGPNLFDLPAKPWKYWRGVFNKGFSAETVMDLVPGMVEETMKYHGKLIKLAESGTMFQLDKVTLRFTLDFIGRATMNSNLGSQDGYNRLADSLLSQTNYLDKIKMNPLDVFSPFRAIMRRWNGYHMDRYIGAELDKRYQEHLQDKVATPSKAVIDLTLQTYIADLKENGKLGTDVLAQRLDPEFRTFAIHQIRLFLFVGYDSMSSTICYAVHLLSSKPSTLEKIRREHDAAFGPDLASLPDTLLANPHLLNSLPYTTAVIKETLRLFAPGAGVRSGLPGSEIIGEDGTRYPITGTMVYVVHMATHRAPEYWHEPDSFIPERWLVEPGHKLYPMKNAWRPFEWGPRACIGQNLAMTELRITLAVLCRQYDIKPAYEEWDSLHPAKGLNTYRGERAYQIDAAAMHPADYYPCKVKLVSRA